MKIMSKIAGIAILLLGMATHASAVTIYATTGIGAGLGTIDSTTGAGTPLSTFSAGSNQGIAFTPDGTLWTIERNSGQVATVDVATGTVTPVGAASGIGSIADLASDAAGNLYGTNGTNLYSIDKATGAVNLIGSFGAGSTMFGIAFYNGVLYSMSWTNVHTVNPATGAVITTVPLSAAPAVNTGYGGLGIDPNSGTAYFINYFTPDTLNSVDLATGQITLIGTTGLGSTFSLDFMPPLAALIDSGGCVLNTETGFGPLLLTLVLLALAFLYRRRTGI